VYAQQQQPASTPKQNKTKPTLRAPNRATEECLSLWGVWVVVCFLFCEGGFGMNFLALSSVIINRT